MRSSFTKRLRKSLCEDADNISKARPPCTEDIVPITVLSAVNDSHKIVLPEVLAAGCSALASDSDGIYEA